MSAGGTGIAGGVGICGIRVACAREVGWEGIAQLTEAKPSGQLAETGRLLMLQVPMMHGGIGGRHIGECLRGGTRKPGVGGGVVDAL